MKRPARLGVGASIPEGYNSATRETARLKGKLAGTKHSREEDDAIVPQKLSDSEGESKAIAIKKRPKFDPFDVVHGKKKKKEKDIKLEETNPEPITASPNVTPMQAAISDQSLDRPEPNCPTLSSTKKKRKRNKLNVENDVEGCEAGTSSAPLCSGPNNLLNPMSTPPHRAKLDLDATRQSQRTVDVSLTSTPALITPRYKSIALDLLKRPLLNLNGPGSDRGSDHEETLSSPKKKRRRRRKKKNALIPSTANTKVDETGNMSSSLE